jgi:hypothetical protein
MARFKNLKISLKSEITDIEFEYLSYPSENLGKNIQIQIPNLHFEKFQNGGDIQNEVLGT